MNSDRIKKIQQGTAYPDSVSVKQALLQVWNECEQDKASQQGYSESDIIKLSRHLGNLYGTVGRSENYGNAEDILKLIFTTPKASDIPIVKDTSNSTALFVLEDIKSALHKAELKHNKSYIQIWDIMLSYLYNKSKEVKVIVTEGEGKLTAMDFKEMEIDELEEQIKTLKFTCVELGKRAIYTEEENKKWYKFECECGFKALSMLAVGGGQIADTGDYGDCLCPCCNRIIS